MSDKIAHIGSGLSHGGSVVQGSPNWTTMGIPIARVGDAVVCAIHGAQTIVSGYAPFPTNGKPTAHIGSLCSCGATIVSSQSNWTIG